MLKIVQSTLMAIQNAYTTIIAIVIIAVLFPFIVYASFYDFYQEKHHPRDYDL